MSPPASFAHNQIGLRLLRLFGDTFPDLVVAYDVGLKVSESPVIRRIPDIGLVEHMEHAHWIDQMPILVVEILSPSTRNEDTLRKSGEYAAAGIGQYWVVDPQQHALTVLAQAEGGWDIALELDAATPTGEVEVAEHGTVALDLDVLLTT